MTKVLILYDEVVLKGNLPGNKLFILQSQSLDEQRPWLQTYLDVAL